MKRASLMILILLLLPVPAQAEGPLRALLHSRSGQNSGQSSGAVAASLPDDGLFGGLGCKRLTKIVERHKGRLEKKAGDVVPSLSAQYGADVRQGMDVYLPRRSTEDAPAPIIVMVHGGAWCVGDKDSGAVTENKIARWLPRGFIFVSVNYRMLPDGADVLTQAADVAQALGYVQHHAAEWHGDSRKIILMGHSAGAHLVSLLGADAPFAAQFNLQPWLGTISLDSAAVDVAEMMTKKHPAFYDDAFGKDEAMWATLSPLRQLSGDSIPWLGVCSGKRKDSCPQAHGFAAKAASLGVEAQVLEENLNHGEINADLGEPGDYTEAVEAFMQGLDPDVAARFGQ